MESSKSAEIYDAFAKHYRAYSEKKSAYIASVDHLIEERFKGKNLDIFDFGAGDGVRGASVFQRLQGHALVCGDISQEMIKRCREIGLAKEVWDLSKPDWSNSSERFDLILCLWNVLGHIPSTQDRITALKKMSTLLKPTGQICFDLNNRHYRGYGELRVQWRRLIDWIMPDYSRGDVHFDWEIDGKIFPAHGHLFTFAEVSDLLSQANLKIVEWKSVNYVTGEVSSNVTNGQHFFIVEKSQTSEASI